METNDSYYYPNSVEEFLVGTKYQTKDIISNEWSDDKEIYKLSYCVLSLLEYFIQRNGVRIKVSV